MSSYGIVKIDRDNVRQLAALRGLPHLEVAEEAEVVWLRAPGGDEAIDRLLSALPGERFQLIDDEQLVPWGKRVPTGRLPRLAWQPLASWSAIVLPVAAMPARGSSRIALRLVRGGPERPHAALLADWPDWLNYATAAPEVRLRSLTFALSAPRKSRAEASPHEPAQRAFIVGSPLPPLAGHSYLLDDGIAVPCGWAFSPAVGSGVIRKLLGLSEGEVALFGVDGSFERIAGEHFVRASRSAVRESGRGAPHVQNLFT